MKIKYNGNMYTKTLNPKFENPSLKTVNVRVMKSLASRFPPKIQRKYCSTDIKLPPTVNSDSLRSFSFFKEA